MQLALYNAKIYREAGRFAEALLVTGNKLSVVGNNEEVLSAAGYKDAIDCRGRTILPGFNDSHIHFIFSGKQLTEANILGSTSIDDLVNRCSHFLEKNPSAAKKGMHAFGWNQDLFTSGEKRMPDRHDLDRISTTVPIVLERVCAHIAVGNTQAIRCLGLDETSPQYEGGQFQRDHRGFPTGIFNEKACEHLLEVLPPPTADDHRAYFKAAMADAVSLGLTSVQSCDIGAISHDHRGILAMMDDVYSRSEGLLRYRHQIYCTSLPQFQERIEDGIFHREENSGGMHTVGPLKIFVDGSLGGRTALLRDGYMDEIGNFGVEVITGEETTAFCHLAAKNNIQTVIHAIGDMAIQNSIDALSHTMPRGNPLRNAIIHCQITDEALLRSIAQNRILIQFQPIFLNSDLHILESRVGEKLASTSYAFRTAMEMPEMRNLVSFGTDAPVETCNPFENIYSAVCRKDLSGFPDGGFYPREAVSVSQAIDAYTLASAYGEFEEHRKGRLMEGYLADLIILDRDIFSVSSEEIKDIRPVLTMVDGKIVYKNNF